MTSAPARLRTTVRLYSFGMDAAWPRRMRWRRRGAWLWPTFVAAILVDVLIGTALPPAGDAQAPFAAGLDGLALNTLGLILLSRPLAAVIRRRRPDLPTVVARDYAGTGIVVGVVTLLLAAGLAHHATLVRDRHALSDAISRAQAYIGARAPAGFRGNVRWISTFAIMPGRLYRACVPSTDGRRTYCVIVDTKAAFPGGVSFAGYEPNSAFSTGVN